MTTPTREQVVQWAKKVTVDCVIDYYSMSASELVTFSTLARADLEATIAEQAKEIEQMRLAEEGAKEAFGHVVQQKRDLEAECKRLRILLDGAYKTIRLFPPGAHQDSPTKPASSSPEAPDKARGCMPPTLHPGQNGQAAIQCAHAENPVHAGWSKPIP